MKSSKPLIRFAHLVFLFTVALSPAALSAADDNAPRDARQKKARQAPAETSERRERAAHRQSREIHGHDMERHLDQLRKRVRELVAAGKLEEAEGLERHIQGLIKPNPEKGAESRGRRMELDEHLATLRREIQELHRAGRHEEAERLELRSRELIAEARRGSTPNKDEEIERESHRLENLRRAIEHLREAEKHDLADELVHEARDREERLERMMDKRMHEENERTERLADEVAELHALVGKLREEIKNLTRRIDRQSREK